MKHQRRLRLIAANGALVGTPPPPSAPALTSVGAAMAAMRACAAVLEALPADLAHEYSNDELRRRVATTQLVTAFRVLDRLTSTPPTPTHSPRQH